MDLTDRDKAILNDLINIAWQAGAIKAPQMAQEVEQIRAKLLAKPEVKAQEVAKNG